MIYNEYGKTDKKISAIGFGGMRFRQEDYIEKAAELVIEANRLGVNYFDTAPGRYCHDQSEPIMGLAFKNMPNPFYVATKSTFEEDPDENSVRKRVENSVKRLNVEKINFYYMWAIRNMEQYRFIMRKGGPYDGAVKAKEDGLIEHLCFSTHCMGEEIETIVNDGGYEGVMLAYNIINFKFRQRGLRAAYEKGLGVVAMNPLGGGIIPRKPEFFKFICENGSDVVNAALRFNVGHKELTSSIVGISDVTQLKEAVAAAENPSWFSDEKINEIGNRVSAEMDSLCTGCAYCLDCPADIEIVKYMEAYNDFILNKSRRAAIGMLEYYWSVTKDGAGKCTQCGKCEKACTQHIDIMNRLHFFAR